MKFGFHECPELIVGSIMLLRLGLRLKRNMKLHEKKILNIARISDFLVFWSFARMKWKSYRPYRLIYCESFTVTIRMHFERMIFWKFRDVSINLGGSAKLRKAIISEIPSRLIYCPLWLNELNNCYACKGWQFKPSGDHWHLANVPFLYPHIRKPEV